MEQSTCEGASKRVRAAKHKAGNVYNNANDRWRSWKNKHNAAYMASCSTMVLYMLGTAGPLFYPSGAAFGAIEATEILRWLPVFVGSGGVFLQGTAGLVGSSSVICNALINSYFTKEKIFPTIASNLSTLWHDDTNAASVSASRRDNPFNEPESRLIKSDLKHRLALAGLSSLSFASILAIYSLGWKYGYGKDCRDLFNPFSEQHETDWEMLTSANMVLLSIPFSAMTFYALSWKKLRLNTVKLQLGLFLANAAVMSGLPVGMIGSTLTTRILGAFAIGFMHLLSLAGALNKVYISTIGRIPPIKKASDSLQRSLATNFTYISEEEFELDKFEGEYNKIIAAYMTHIQDKYWSKRNEGPEEIQRLFEASQLMGLQGLPLAIKLDELLIASPSVELKIRDHASIKAFAITLLGLTGYFWLVMDMLRPLIAIPSFFFFTSIVVNVTDSTLAQHKKPMIAKFFAPTSAPRLSAISHVMGLLSSANLLNALKNHFIDTHLKDTVGHHTHQYGPYALALTIFAVGTSWLFNTAPFRHPMLASAVLLGDDRPDEATNQETAPLLSDTSEAATQRALDKHIYTQLGALASPTVSDLALGSLELPNALQVSQVREAMKGEQQNFCANLGKVLAQSQNEAADGDVEAGAAIARLPANGSITAVPFSEDPVIKIRQQLGLLVAKKRELVTYRERTEASEKLQIQNASQFGFCCSR